MLYVFFENVDDFTMVLSCFLLPGGNLGAMFGGLEGDMGPHTC